MGRFIRGNRKLTCMARTACQVINNSRFCYYALVNSLNSKYAESCGTYYISKVQNKLTVENGQRGFSIRKVKLGYLSFKDEFLRSMFQQAQAKGQKVLWMYALLNRSKIFNQ